MWDSSIFVFLSSLTPKFYVALTGTSSLISGLILIFEWCYYRKYGTSFIEHISLNHISPLFGGDIVTVAATGSNNRTGYANSNNNSNHNNNNNSNDSSSLNCSSSDVTNTIQTQPSVTECKVWRNPMSLFRGAEYQRFFWATNKEPLTFYDMNLSAQDHQNFFICESDVGKGEYEHMQNAWRERNPALRVKASKAALEINPDYVPAHILLAEEEASNIHEVEKIFKMALKLAESNYKKSHNNQHQNAQSESLHRRDTNILIYVKRRLGMCARKLGKLKDAVKIFRDLAKEMPSIMNGLNVHENLIEVLLELQAYADVQAVLAKYDDINLPKSATICYTAALLKARNVSEKFSVQTASRRPLTATESAAIEAIHRAVEFNPHVPRYLLEIKPLIFPPEHVLKRGDSEAVSYAFFHQRHWKQLDGALNLLQCTWQGTFQLLPYPLEKGHLFYPYPSCTECADRELLPAFHDVSVYPKKEIPFFIVFTAALCTFTALLAVLTHQFPDYMSSLAKFLLFGFSYPASVIVDAARTMSPLAFQFE